MDVYTIDVETYYSSAEKYTLRHMTTVDYVLDPRFQLISLSAMKNAGAPEFYFGADAEAWLREVPLENNIMLAHNTIFDAAVLFWRYGKKAAYYMCTMSMANAVVRPYRGSSSMDAVAKHYGIGTKGSFVTANMNGKRREDVTPDMLPKLQDYNNDDVRQCYTGLRHMIGEFPRSELDLINEIVKMYVFPKLALREDVLAESLTEIRAEKQWLLEQAGLADRKVLMSNDKFAAVLGLLLGSHNKVPRKISPTTGKLTYAFSKKDKAFTDLQEHPSPAVRNVVEARLGHKSTILETRTERLLGIARRWRMLPVPLRYYGAHTGRLSGTDLLNLQNLTRGSQLRYAIIPLEDGYVLVVVDASQIECRFLVTWAGQWDVVNQFRTKQDVYANFASRIYGYAINKIDHPDERFVGKTGVLSLGYGAGVATFHTMLWSTRSKAQIEAGFAPDEVLAERVVETYRNTHDQVRALWREADRSMVPALMPNGFSHSTGPFVLEPGFAHLPNGMRIPYPDIRVHMDEDGKPIMAYGDKPELVYGHGRMKKTIYGPKVVENLDQAATRIIISDAWLAVKKYFPVALQVHDELVFAVKAKDAERCLEMTSEELSRPPAWMPDIPLAAEGSIGPNYGEAK